MRCLVPIKRVLDWTVKPRVKADKSSVDLTGAKMSMNPFCEIAIEEATRLKEKKKLEEIIAFTIGPKGANETLKTALAIGADRGIHVQTEERIDMTIQPLMVAKIIQHFILKEKVSLVIAGKQSIDDDLAQTGQMLAALLGWPQACFASKVELSDKDCVVDRDIDGGVEVVKFPLPGLITCDLRLNEPRNASIKQIMAAKKKPIETVELSSLKIEQTPSFKYVSVEEPPKRKGGIKVADVDELIKRLKTEAKVL